MEIGCQSEERLGTAAVQYKHCVLYSDTSANEDNSFRNHIR